MVWTGALKGGEFQFEGDQNGVLGYYFGKQPGRVCVSAGAGTGKTTLLVEIYSEAAIRLYEKNPDENPFEKILAVTFGVEATRQMKSRVRSRLERHFLAKGNEEAMRDIIRHLESGSWIVTLDSLTREMLHSAALDAGLNPIGSVPDAYEIAKIQDRIIDHIARDPNCHNDYQVLSNAFPEDWWEEQSGWRGLLKEGFSRARRYCLTADEFSSAAIESINELYKNAFLSGKKMDNTALAAMLASLRTPNQAISVARASASFHHNLAVLEAFCRLLSKYEEMYDAETKDKGWLGYDDARFWIVRYLRGKLKGTQHIGWLDSQKNRFHHILVDEFQDTSYAQCELLRSLMGPKTSVLLIGDPKQAIYQWRNAEPGIFLQIIASLPNVYSGKVSGKIPFLDASGFVQVELLSNYRSNQELIDLYNDIFGNTSVLFGNQSYTGGYNIPHGDLVRKAPLPKEHVEEPRIHVMDGNDAAVIASELDAIRSKNKVLHVRKADGKKEVWREAKLGDCCVLMQTRTPWPGLRQQLINRGIRYTMIAEKGLFKRPEISLIIDILDWLGNPHKKDALARILRSPLVGLSDRALRFMAYHEFRLDACLTDVNRPTWFDGEARIPIEKLIDLRDDIRWLREGKKNEMIEMILRYSHLDTILLSHTEGEQAFANIRYFQDLVRTWEAEKLLGYQELVDRLIYFRTHDNDESGIAPLADDKDVDSVRIATVHATKGLEFPIVFHLHPRADMNKQWAARGFNASIFTSNMGRFVFLEQLAPPGATDSDWENLLHPARNLQDLGRGPFEAITREAYAEKWRLFYVGLTRARDHVYFESYNGRAQCWASWLGDWHSSHRTSRAVEYPVMARAAPGAALGGVQMIQFDGKRYKHLKAATDTFTPFSLNPSHVYDLIFCPRRYQYSVLQEVKGGPPPLEYKNQDFNALRFGKHLHKALELIDFSKGPGIDYDAFKARVAEHDAEEAKELDEAVQGFLSSDLFKKYGLDKRRATKELRLLHKIDDPAKSLSILMRDMADLVVEDGKNSIVLIDYKTNYPKGKSIRDDFTRRHYDYQLASYRDALMSELGLKVSKTIFFDYDLSTKRWSEFAARVDKIDIRQEVLNIVPIPIEQGGLVRKPRKEFCEDHCAFKNLCQPEY